MSHCHTFIAALRQRGYRITPQREIIIETIAHSGRHMAADEVMEVVHQRARSVNTATVYRTLDFLVKEGMASRLDLGGGHIVYATTKHGPHIHLVCRQCGCTIQVEREEVAALCQQLQHHVQQHHCFAVDLNHFSLTGLCAACQAEHPSYTKPPE